MAAPELAWDTTKTNANIITLSKVCNIYIYKRRQVIQSKIQYAIRNYEIEYIVTVFQV